MDKEEEIVELTPEEEKLQELLAMIEEARLRWTLDNLLES